MKLQKAQNCLLARIGRLFLSVVVVWFRFLPKLEFRFDSLTQSQRQIERVFRELDIEEDRDRLEAATKHIYDEQNKR